MRDEPGDTWELAQQLEKLAKLLRRAPRFVFAKEREIFPQLTLTIDEPSNYTRMTVKNLRILCKERNIKIPSRSKKADIIRFLKENDEGIKTIDKISTAFED